MIRDYLFNIAKAFDPRPYFGASIALTESRGVHGQKTQPFSYQLAVDQFYSWVFIAANLNAKAVAAVPLRLFIRRRPGRTKLWESTSRISRSHLRYLRGESGESGVYPSEIVRQKIIEFGAEEIEEVTERHPIMELLRTVNPHHNGFDSTWLRMLYLQITGNSYMHPVMDERLNRPTALWTMPSQWTWIKSSRETFLEGYVYGRQAHEQVTFTPDEVVHWKLPNLNDMHYGRGYVESIWSAWNLHTEKRATDLSHYQNRARPDWLMIVRKGSTPEQIKRYETDINKQLKGSRNTGRFMAISGDVLPQQLNFPEQIIGDTDRVVEEISGAFGVPVTKLFANDPNRANAETGDAGWQRDSILPLCRLDEQTLNEQIVPLFNLGDDAFVAYDNPVPRDRKFQLERDTRQTGAGIITIDEARAEAGLSPLEDGLGAVARFNGVPLDEVGQQPGFDLGGMFNQPPRPVVVPAPIPIVAPVTAPLPDKPALLPPPKPADDQPDPVAAGGDGEAAENIAEGEKLNGAQITAAIDILNGLKTGDTAELVAVELLIAVGINSEKAANMVEATIELVASKPAPAVAPAPDDDDTGKTAAGMNTTIPSEGGFAVADDDKANGEGDHKLGVVMAPVTSEDIRSKMWQVLDAISEDDIAEDEGGVEYESHITVKYGFTAEHIEDILPSIRDVAPIEATLGKVRMFQSDQADVIYVEVESQGLVDLNAELSKLPNEDEHDQYIPHMTLAYLQPGKGEQFVDDDRFEGMGIIFNSLDVQTGSGETAIVELRNEEPGDGDDKVKVERLPDELFDDCVSRAIPILVAEGMDQDQAVAAANSMCKIAGDDDKPKTVLASCDCCTEDDGGPMPINFKGWKKPALTRPSADPDAAVPEDPDKLGDADDPVREGEERDPIERLSDDMAAALTAAQELLISRIAAMKGKAVPGKARSRIVKVSQEDIDRLLRGAEREMRNAVEGLIKESLGEIIATGGKIGSDRIGEVGGVALEFDVVNPDVVEFVNTHTIQLADELSTSTINRLRPQLVEAAQAGMSNQSIAALLETDKSGLFSAERANTIARTESARAFVEGEQEGWKQSGVVEGVQWLLSPGACEYCHAVAKQFEGKVVPLGESFLPKGTTLTGTNGGSMKLDYSAINGPPLHVNCRCDLNPVISSD